jgi:hypothetical protein
MQRAIGDYFQSLRIRWPNAKLVFVIPCFIRSDPPSYYPEVLAYANDVLAPEYGVEVIDPVAERWFKNVNLRPLLLRDGVHPNSAGIDYYTDKLLTSLRHLGLADHQPPTSGAQR